VTSVGEKFEEALKNKGKTPEQLVSDKAAADKAAADKAAAEKAAEKNKPTVVKDDSDDAIKKEIEVKTKGMDGAAKQAWADLRYAERDLRRQMKDMVPSTRLTELQKQLKDTQDALTAAKTAGPAEIQQLRDELAAAKKRDEDREQELTATKIERTEAFKKAVTQPREKIEAMAKSLAKKYEISERELLDALNDTSDAQTDRLTELTEKMNRFEVNKIDSAVGELASIREREADLRATSKDVLAKLEATRSTQTDAEKAQAKAAREAAHSKNWDALKEALPDVLTPAEGTDEAVQNWNKAQADAETFAKTADYSSYAPEIQSQLLQRAAVFPLIAGALQSAKDQLAAEKAAHEATKVELGKFLEKKPGAQAESPEDKQDPAKGEKDFVKRLSARFAAAGV
ncbi:MAG TPA: hypothetical protein VFA15_09890, partial [Nitrososphaera sp.]|nr:hypothetical protein [Nitrososphaera sp.]